MIIKLKIFIFKKSQFKNKLKKITFGMNTRESVNVVQKIIKKLIIAYASFNFS